MPATVTVDCDRRPALSIRGAGGKEGLYLLLPADPDKDRWAFRLARVDGGGSYRVAQDRAGRVRCTCASHAHRGHLRPCKHRSAVEALVAFLEGLEARTTGG